MPLIYLAMVSCQKKFSHKKTKEQNEKMNTSITYIHQNFLSYTCLNIFEEHKEHTSPLPNLICKLTYTAELI